MKYQNIFSSGIVLKWVGLTLSTLAVATILMLGVRGYVGSPSAEELSSDYWQKHGPLELSPERGRFALLYSIVEEGSLKFSLPVARLAIPDLAVNDAGEYVSLFAPAVSFIAVPGYIVGKYFGASVAGAYAAVALFALVNFLFIRAIAIRLGAEPWAALVAALTFSLATPALPYAGTLYQHHVTVFLLLLSLWVLVAFRNIWSLAIVWFACALSVVVDNPNVFLMFPIGLFSIVRLWQLIVESPSLSKRTIRGVIGMLTLLVMFLPLGFFAWYNQSAYGNPLQLPGTLRGVDEIGADGRPAKETAYESQTLSQEQLASEKSGSTKEKTAIGFFKTRNLYNGFYIHFLSPDRSVLWFAPAVLLGVLGLAILYGRHRQLAAAVVAAIGANVLLYSMWGDPWGGWAFGSRYLIPTYALLAIGVAFALSRWRFSLATLFVFVPLFIFSLWVNTLGAVTTIANPPKVEVLVLEKQSKHEEKYTFMRNWEFLEEKYQPAIGSKSFIYQAWAKDKMTARDYHRIIFGIGLATFLLVLITRFVPWRLLLDRIQSRRV